MKEDAGEGGHVVHCFGKVAIEDIFTYVIVEFRVFMIESTIKLYHLFKLIYWPTPLSQSWTVKSLGGILRHKIDIR